MVIISLRTISVCISLFSSFLALNDVESTADVTLEVSSLQATPPEGKKRRGRPRKSETQPRRRNRTLRFCVDPNPPQISRGRYD